jgi:hypothetical protein
MSHFLRIKTQIREREPLVQALRALHHQFQEGENLTVRGFVGAKTTADIVVNTGCDYDIGFQRKNQEYEIVADWWGVERRSQIKQDSFVQQVSQQYAYLVVREQAREQVLTVEDERTMENGDIVITLSERA